MRQITKKVQYWTYEEFQRFLSVIEGNSYLGCLKRTGFYFLFFTGLRIGEMMARKWTDIDWDNQSIYVDSTLYYRNKENWSASTKDGTKTASSTGWVKLTPKIIEMLKEWREKQRDIFGDIPYIFMCDGTMYTPTRWNCWKTTLVKKWNKTAKENEVLENIRVHDLRDSHGMWLLSQGIDIKTIQKRLCHAKATTTMNYYLDRLPENEEKVLQGFKK
ncbi:site-specific integrase [Niallia sp. FSL R7-0271]|uniref:site-specific integrase n=1 Tax=Niallia sp. FSL R7-0271 TaxID=2921678 RepID=UPI0030F59238